MISITRLLELKKDLALAKTPILDNEPRFAALARLGAYLDILEDYLRIQQGSA